MFKLEGGEGLVAGECWFSFFYIYAYPYQLRPPNSSFFFFFFFIFCCNTKAVTMASSLSTNPFLGTSRKEGFSSLGSLSSDLRTLSLSPNSLHFSTASPTLKKLREFFLSLFHSISFIFASVELELTNFVLGLFWFDCFFI